MGSSKKKSVKRMEKQQILKVKKQHQKKRSKKAESKVSDLQLNMPNIDKKEFLQELSKMNVITPYVLASKYTIKISMAKKMINALKQKGFIQLIASNANLKIYKYKQ